ncbi:MAG TPA: response regulator [Acetobacteraceae bacterium]|nr:response regulator [Acetobacteraceae bacterium]
MFAASMCDVLILEDDLLVRTTFADILADEGFIVREAGSAAEAWAVLHEPAGARVLLADKDLGAPPGESDGFAMAAEALRRHPALIVVYASGQPDALGGRALTGREYALPKPFMPQALVALVRQVIG